MLLRRKGTMGLSDIFNIGNIIINRNLMVCRIGLKEIFKHRMKRLFVICSDAAVIFFRNFDAANRVCKSLIQTAVYHINTWISAIQEARRYLLRKAFYPPVR